MKHLTKKERIRKKREQTRNRKLIKQYPWLVPRNVWTGKIPKDYDYTYINWGWSDGWDKAFGDMYLQELGDAVKRSGFEDQFEILQQKEKWGRCVNYVGPVNEEIMLIVDKYEQLSGNICYGCGKPDVPMIDDGWLTPWCYECFRKNWKRREEWILRNNPGREPTPEETIQSKYQECVCDDGKMADGYTVRRFGKDKDKEITYDFSDTANQIRMRYERRMRNREKRH